MRSKNFSRNSILHSIKFSCRIHPLLDIIATLLSLVHMMKYLLKYILQKLNILYGYIFVKELDCILTMYSFMTVRLSTKNNVYGQYCLSHQNLDTMAM